MHYLELSTKKFEEPFFYIAKNIINFVYSKYLQNVIHMNFTRLLHLICILGISFSICAQKITTKGQYFTLPKNLQESDYQKGIVLLKIKKEHKQAFLRYTHERVSIFDNLPNARLNTLASVKEVEKSLKDNNAKRGNGSLVDISLFYQLSFDQNAMSVEDAINQLYASGLVEIAEPSYTAKYHFIPNDPRVNQQYYLNNIKATQAWDLIKGKSEIVIAIVDSGVDLDHPDLKDAIWKNTKEVAGNKIDDDNNGFIDDVNGWDFVGADTLKFYQNFSDPTSYQDNDPSVIGSNNFHGTSVAGCAAATGNNSVGIAGVGYGSRIMALKCSADNDTRAPGGYGYVMNQLSAVLYAADNGAHIINCSFGGTNKSEIQQQIYTYATLEKGCLVVASAGNEGRDFNYPASYDHVLSVTSVDKDEKVVGHTTNTLVDVSAPGQDIFTTNYNDDYSSLNGTSFASPITAGAAALVKAKYPDFSGFQIGEILRATSDEVIYKTNPLSRKVIGKGRIDIQKALTSQTPSVRMNNVKLFNKFGGTAQAGDTATFVADFTNYLWATNNLEVSISVNSSSVKILQNTAKIGTIGTLESKSNAGSPFRISISKNISDNSPIEFLITFKDGNYTDYQYYTLVLNPTYLNFERNFVSTTVSGKGRIGYDGDSQKDGIGFIINGSDNLLYEMGLMSGTSANKLISSTRGTGDVFDNEYQSVARIKEISDGGRAPFEVYGRLNDSKNTIQSSNVEISYRAMAWAYPPYQNFVMFEYVITNKGNSTLNNFFTGLYADWDISESGAKDRADWNADYDLGYVYNFGDGSNLFAGLQVLTGKSNYFAIDNDHRISGNPFGVYDDFTDSEKFQSISNGVGRKQAGMAEKGGDVSHTVGVGPYTIAAGDSVIVAFALHGANSVNELLESAKSAKQLYTQTFNATRPIVNNVDACYGSAATLKATGATKFKWYASIDAGTPVFEGSTYETKALKGDSTYYVSNAEQPFESIRTKVVARTKANPIVFTSGGEKICEGEQTTLSVAKADSYLWNNGATTQSIIVTQAGEYFVKVKDNVLGCENTSEKIVVSIFPKPVAQFSMNTEILDLGVATKVKFTDQSQNAVSWFWEFGDGTTSTFQNPEQEFSSLGTKTIKLSVTSQGGCVSTISKTLTVTALEDEILSQIKVFPNPNAGTFKVELGDFDAQKLTLYNALGVLVDAKEVKKGEATNFELVQLPKGMYYLRLESAEKTYTKKVVIE
jgi:subtilisin family serine protease